MVTGRSVISLSKMWSELPYFEWLENALEF
jgi:hypothetical protein